MELTVEEEKTPHFKIYSYIYIVKIIKDFTGKRHVHHDLKQDIFSELY